jgi:hypothetical protein
LSFGFSNKFCQMHASMVLMQTRRIRSSSVPSRT